MEESATLVKFGLFEHLFQLRDQGLIYMNNLLHFWKIEDEELRGDVNDSIDELMRGKKGKLKDNTNDITTISNWQLRIQPLDADKINIFSLYALRPHKGTFPIPQKNNKFGTHALVFTEPQVFIEKISTLFRENSIDARAGLVTYVDDNYAGKIGPFIKLRKFGYQSEWRIVCYNGPGIARKFFIGSLKDISIILPSQELNDKIKIDNSGNIILS